MITSVLAFLFSPLGKVVLLGLAIMSAVAFIDRRATYRERGRCEAAVIQAKLDAARKDLEISQKTEAAAVEASSRIQNEAETAKRKLADYEQALKARGNSACNLTDDDLRWLRDGAGTGAPAKKPPAGR